MHPWNFLRVPLNLQHVQLILLSGGAGLLARNNLYDDVIYKTYGWLLSPKKMGKVGGIKDVYIVGIQDSMLSWVQYKFLSI